MKDQEASVYPPTAGFAPDALPEARRRYRWCQKWTEALSRLRQDFDGDLDQYLLFLVFQQDEMATTLSSLNVAAMHRDVSEQKRRGMNAMSVAEICGIPRETARRKLKRLVERKIIGIGADGLYYLAPATTRTPAVEDMARLYAPGREAGASESPGLKPDRGRRVRGTGVSVQSCRMPSPPGSEP